MAADLIDPEVVNTGTYDDDGTGDNLRGAFDKLNLNGLTLGRHANDRENPHGVTAHQVGAYTQAEVDGLIASLGTLSDLLVLLGQINATAAPIQAGLAVIDGLIAEARAAVTQTGEDAQDTAADALASGGARSAAEAARDLTQGYRDAAKTYRDQAEGLVATVDNSAFVRKDGSTPFAGAQPFNGGLNLKPGAASAAPANGDLTADATGKPAARVAGVAQPLALASEVATQTAALAARDAFLFCRAARG